LKKLLFGLGFAIVAVIVAVVAAPWLIDASQYRGEIARRLSVATGRDVAIDGPVTFVLLPSPRVRASNVRVVAAEGDASTTIDAKHVELELGWASLLGQALEITNLRVIEPHVTIAAARPAATAGPPQLSPIAAVRIERTEIQNGRVVWSDPGAKTPRTIEQLQATILASPLASSVRVTGSAVASAVPMEFDAIIGDAPAGRPNPVSLTLGMRPNLARATLRGNYDASAQSLRGRLQIEGADLFAAAESVTHVDPWLAGVASQPFSAGGDLTWTQAGFAANDLVLQLGDLRASGAINATSGRTLAVDVALAMTFVDLDKLSKLERRAAAPPRMTPPSDAAARVGMGQAQPAAIPAVDLALDLGIDAVGLNGGTLRQVRLNAVMARGDLVINQASALLPGETEFNGFAQIELTAATPRVDGTLNARSDNLRGLLQWLGVETKDVPAGRLRRFSGQARIEGTPSRLELTGIDLAFDSTRATGGIAIALGQRIGLGADIRVDQLNLDGYALAADAKAGKDSLFDRFDANLTFAAQTVTWAGEPLGDVSLDILLQSGDITLRNAVVTDIAGARAEARGKIAAVTRQPNADLEIAVRADDSSRLLRFADLTALNPVPLSLTARLRGAPGGDMTFEAVDLTYGKTHATGRAALAGSPRRLSIDLATGTLALDGLPRSGGTDGAGLGVDAVVKADALSWGAYELAGARVEAHVGAGGPVAFGATGKIFDGALDFAARSDGADRNKLNGSLALRDVDLKSGLSALLGTAAISGRGDLTASFGGPARLGSDLLTALSGSLEFSVRDGALAGIDLPLMNRMLDPNNPPTDIVGLLGAGLHGSGTPFTTMNGAARIQQGAVTVDSLRIATAVGEATGSGGADLTRGTIDFNLTLPIAARPVPPIHLLVGGSLEEPGLSLDFSRLHQYLSRREARTPGQDGGSQ
jgi:uncharacterized protein involved in outer membrane biogenesis